MPRFGDVFVDIRGDDRTLRISQHPDQRVVVLSLWLGTTCRGTFRMSVDQIARFVAAFTEMGDAADASTTPERRDAAIADTGEITGTANRSHLPFRPVLRTA